MRGGDERSGALFSYVDLEARVRRIIRCGRSAMIVNEALAALDERFLGALFADGSAVDPAGEAAAGDAAAGVLFDPLGAAADGAAGVRSAVSLVRGPWRRRSGVGSLDLLEEPRPAAGGRYRGEVPERGAGAAAGEAAASSTEHFSVDGTLIEAWASMKSFKPKEGRDEPPADGGGRNAGGGFPRREAIERDACLDHRSGGRLYRKGPGKEAKLCFIGHALMENRYGLIVDACLTPSRRACRADRGAAHDRAARRPAACDHARRRQGL